MESHRELDVAVIGAGFSGLATAAALRRYGVDRIALIEGGSQYGEFWATNYDRIKLHSPWHDLPDDGGLVNDYPMFKNRLELLEYFHRYGDRHSLPEVTSFDNFVSSIEREPSTTQGWKIRGNEEFVAKFVVVATGYCRVPVVPNIPGMEAFEGPLVHSKSYLRPDPFKGQNVLVVGSGNSGCEIATDLIENGATSVSLLVYGGRYFIPIERFGNFVVEARKEGLAGPEGVKAVHPITPGTREYLEQVEQNNEGMIPLLEDLSEFGIEDPEAGPAYDLIVAQRVPVLDHGVIPLIRQRAIDVVKDRIDRFTPTGVTLRENGARNFDAVVMATGFRPGLEEFLSPDLTEYREESGQTVPKTDRRCHSRVHENLYFAGFDLSLWGGLSHGLWGFEVAEKIAKDLGVFRPEMRPADFGGAPWLAH